MDTLMTKVSRRAALRLGLIAGAAPLAWQTAIAGDNPRLEADATGLTSYLHGGQVVVRWNNFPVATYRASPIQKYPYLSHLAGPATGLPMTTESSVPFPHHRGVWLGCDPLNGGDYWTDAGLEKGQVRSIDLKLGETTPTSVEICNRCQWLRGGAGSPLVDQRSITFRILSDRTHAIDFDVQFTTLEKIRIKRAKHSLFALRVAPDLAPTGGGNLLSSEGGQGEAGTFGKPAGWCGYFGRRAGSDAIEGIAVMDHPANPWNPCPWFTRDYGHLSPSPFNFLKQPWELGERQQLHLRYRVVTHAGTPKEAALDQIYKEWSEA
jgi:hypothetical protein